MSESMLSHVIVNYWYEDSMVVITRTKKDLGWRTLNEKKYYIVDDGGSPKKSHIATGWTKIGTVTYRFDSNGMAARQRKRRVLRYGRQGKI